MTDYCATSAAAAGFVSSTVSYVDCQAQILGTGAWEALAAPNSTLHLVLHGFLTLVFAVIGYELLLGKSLSLRQGTLTLIKIAMVFALATSWPAYQTLVYELVMDGPQQLVREIGPAGGVAGSDGTLLQRLDAVDDTMARLAILGPGYEVTDRALTPPPPIAGFDSFALGGGRLLFLITAIGSLGVVRLVSGLMLALGPFFIAFLMFNGTRSLFEGWVRVLGGTTLAAVGVALALGLELAFLEPWLATMVAARTAGQALPSLPAQLFVITALTALMVVASLFASLQVARAFRLAPILASERPRTASATVGMASQSVTSRTERSHDRSGRSRATAMAQLLSQTSRRDDSSTSAARTTTASLSRPAVTERAAARHQPTGQRFRRAGARFSGIAKRRDRRS